MYISIAKVFLAVVPLCNRMFSDLGTQDLYRRINQFILRISEINGMNRLTAFLKSVILLRKAVKLRANIDFWGSG